MFFQKDRPLDGKPTMAEWPVRIWAEDEVKEEFRPHLERWMRGAFEDYQLVYAPKRSTVSGSSAYLFGYGLEEILCLRQSSSGVEPTRLRRGEIREAVVERNLLNMELALRYSEGAQAKVLAFPYIASVYYLYDPFLNWILGRPLDFMPQAAEKEHPRPEKLFQESLAMYNFSLDAYRLGDGFTEYAYRQEQTRRRWMPWKIDVKEWLDIPMERGTFKLYHDGYYRKYQYCGISGPGR